MATAIEPIESLEDLDRKIFLPPEVLEDWLKMWDWTHHQLARKEFPPGFKSLQEFQNACLINDPALWVQFFLKEPEDPDHQDPYGLWYYQAEDLRYRGHKVYYCGAEVGKTRDIVADSLYMACTVRNGSGLIGAPQQTHLEEIIDAMRDQMRWNPVLEKMLCKHRKHPHHAFFFANEFKIDFRPAGHDGEAFRGVHARTFAKLDEAAKIDHDKQWNEFWRAVKPFCAVVIYSVPDGRRDTQFYKLGQRAKAAGKQDEEVLIESFKDVKSHVRDIEFRYIHRPKTIMPEDFWNPKRKKFFIDQYGGEDSPGYHHNVLGIDGDPEYSVFPYQQLRHCIKDISEYRALKILCNASRNEVSVYGYRCEYVPGDDGPIPRQVSLIDTVYDFRTFFAYNDLYETEFKRLIRNFFNNVSGLKVSGGDFGFSQDPTELIVKNVIGRTERLVARLQLKHVTYDQQCQALDALDDVYGPLEESMWGTDFGNAGSAVAHILQGEPRYQHKNYEGRLRGFMFESTTENVNEDGEPLMDGKTGKPAKITMKELATDIMVTKMQKQEIELPPDPDITQSFTNQTVKAGKHRIFSKENDHPVDAYRASVLSRVKGQVVEDVFVSGN